MRRHKHRKRSTKLKSVPSGPKLAKNRRIIAEGADEDREYALHATKGYRSNRNPDAVHR